MVLFVSPVAIHYGYGKVIDSLAAITYVQDLWAPLTNRATTLLSHTWSLGVEEQFYLIWPAVLGLLAWRLRPAAKVVVGGMIVCVALTAVALIVASPELAYPLPVTHLPVMGWGVLLAMALQDDKWKARLQWAGHPWVPLCTFGLLVIALFKLSIDQRWLYEGGLAVLGIVPTVLVAHLVMSPNGAASRALSLQPLVWLGERSYGFYLWHFPIVAFLSFQGHPPWMIFAIGLPSSLVVTELSWRFVERPFNQLKDRRFGSPVNLPGEPVS